MFELKVLVAPQFKLGVIIVTKWRQCFFVDAVEVDAIVFKRVIRRQIHAATKPPEVLLGFVLRFGHKKPHFRVQGRDVGVVWMKY